MVDPHLVSLADQAAARYGVPPALFRQLVQAESGWNPSARSGSGAIGLTQVVPRWHPTANLSTPASQLDYGAKHLGSLLKKYGNPQDALAVYNSGKPWAVSQSIPETRAYVQKILGGYQAGGQTAPAMGPMPQQAPELSAGKLDTKRLLMLLRNQRGRSLRGIMPAPNFRKELGKLAKDAYVPRAGQAPPTYATMGARAPALAAPTSGGGGYGWANSLAGQFGLQVTSTFRDPEHNRRVGGSPTSAHMTKGAAADFSGSPEAMRRLAEAAIRSGKAKEVFFDPLGLYLDNGRVVKGAIGGHSDHVHITWR